MKTFKDLQPMIGRSYLYEGDKHFIEGIEERGGFAVLVTDRGEIQLSLNELDEELEYLKETKTTSLARVPMVLEMIGQSGSMYADLQKTLVESIQKIKEDPKYITQASAINDTVKTVIDLEKVKIQALGLLKG